MSNPVKFGGGFAPTSLSGNAPLSIPLSSGPSQTPSKQATVNDDGTISSGTLCGWTYTMSNLDSTTQIRDTLKVYKQYVTMQISPANEQAYINHTLFLVKLQPSTASQVFEDTGGMRQFTKHKDYFCPDPVGVATNQQQFGVYMNSQRYKIIRKWNIHTEGLNEVSDGYQMIPRKKTIKFTVNYGGTKVKATAGGPTQTGVGDDTSITSVSYDEMDPASKYWLVCFNDDESADLESPTIQMSFLVSGAVC